MQVYINIYIRIYIHTSTIVIQAYIDTATA